MDRKIVIVLSAAVIASFSLPASSSVHKYHGETFFQTADGFLFRGGREGLFTSTPDAVAHWTTVGKGLANGKAYIRYVINPYFLSHSVLWAHLVPCFIFSRVTLQKIREWVFFYHRSSLRRFDHLRFHRPEAEAKEAPRVGDTGMIEALIFPVRVNTGSPRKQDMPIQQAQFGMMFLRNQEVEVLVKAADIEAYDYFSFVSYQVEDRGLIGFTTALGTRHFCCSPELVHKTGCNPGHIITRQSEIDPEVKEMKCNELSVCRRTSNTIVVNEASPKAHNPIPEGTGNRCSITLLGNGNRNTQG